MNHLQRARDPPAPEGQSAYRILTELVQNCPMREAGIRCGLKDSAAMKLKHRIALAAGHRFGAIHRDRQEVRADG